MKPIGTSELTASAFTDAELGEAEFRAIADVLRREARIHLAEAKHSLVHSRLSRRLREHGLMSFSDYVARIHADPEERAAMVVALTTNHTHFFREVHHFDHLRATVLPKLRETVAHQQVRIRSAGCSTGEEPYSIAMCLLGEDRATAARLQGGDVRVLATDIAPHVIDATNRGYYPESIVQHVPERYRALWMRPKRGGFEMTPEARKLVSARLLNLFGNWPMRQLYDVIFCRNVMIYFDDADKAELEARLVGQLAPGGYLYIGHSERLVGSAQRGMTSCGQTIYRKDEACT